MLRNEAQAAVRAVSRWESAPNHMSQVTSHAYARTHSLLRLMYLSSIIETSVITKRQTQSAKNSAA